ncbi:MBL fold metallo-hydrolase [Candidatus Nitrospira salsa]|nr:MAG: MBL fold hydrolase [Nitrospirales bacterium]
MLFKQYYLKSLSHASYLIGDEEAHLAAVVDPQRDIDRYLEDLEIHQLTLRYVFLTHFHTDFVAGHLELHQQTGAEICLSAQAHADYAFRPMRNGFDVELGAVRLNIIETPGHTRESISIIVYDQSKSREQPYAVLTGDTLLIGDVGRPDLITENGYSPSVMAGQLYNSLHDKLLSLPDEVLVYPTHGDSVCGKTLGIEHVSSIGTQRQSNHALQPMTKNAFITLMTTDRPEVPEYFSYIAFLNRRDHPTMSKKIEESLNPLELDQVIHLKSDRAQILDVRTPEEFATGHLCGSLNISLDGNFEIWSATILNREHPIVLLANSGQEKEALIRLARVGLEQVVGYLQRGVSALASTPELTLQTDRLSATHLSELIMTAHRPHILDVRSKQEWQQRHIDDSRNIPLPKLTMHLQEIPNDHPIVTHCANGYRSSIAVSLLEQHGFTNIKDLIGGFDAWEAQVVNPSLHSSESLHQAGDR